MPVFLLVTLLLGLATSQRIKDSIYTDIEQIRPCFRRLNGSQEIGCSSALGGNVGVVQYLEREGDLAGLLAEGFGPYVVLVSPAIFSGHLLRSLRASGQVVGVVLPDVEEGRWEGQYPPAGYSADRRCPNSGSSFYHNTSSYCREEDKLTSWNPQGSNSMWEDWGFPIFLVKDSKATEELHQCWEDHNQAPLSWPLCSVELKASMYAAKDSETCVRRSNLFNITPLTVCDALSDSNIVYFAKPRNATTPQNASREEPDRSVIVVAARMDALALFDQVEVGFDSPSTGIVTLLATAKLVAEAVGEKSFSFKAGVQNILFLLIHGESFDYIGSSRLAYDMEHDAFPYNLSQAVKDGRFWHNGTQPLLQGRKIRYWLELGQLGLARGQDIGPLYLHTSGESTEVTDALLANKGPLDVRDSRKTALPPCSAQSILKVSPSLPTVLLSNYDQQYLGGPGMYHSIYDSAAYHGYNVTKGPSQPVVSRLSSVARMAASAVLSLASEVVPTVGQQQELVNQLLHCYTVTANCTVFHEASEPGNFPWLGGPPTTAPFPQYVGVRGSAHTLMTRLVLQYFTGLALEGGEVQGIEEVVEDKPDIEKDRAACLERNKNQNVYNHVYLVGKGCYNKTQEVVECGVCYQTTVFTTPASSPAFLPGVIETYSWSSGLYPTWTESIWKVISARLFLQGDPRYEHGILALGVIILLTSLSLVWWLEKRAQLIFGESGCQADPAPVNM